MIWSKGWCFLTEKHHETKTLHNVSVLKRFQFVATGRCKSTDFKNESLVEILFYN